jgi:hypothetical protein
MMVIETLSNEELETQEKLMLVVYYLGMADRHQLSKLLNLSVYTIDQAISKLNKKNKEEKHFISLSAPFNRGPKMYQLGPAGWDWVMGWLEEDRKYYERSDAQKRHYRGMTDILVRLLAAMGREEAFNNLRFYNTNDATELFLYPWQVAYGEEWEDRKFRQEKCKGMPKPDFFIENNKEGWWGEFDTRSEGPNRIKGKLRQYYRAFNQLGERSRSRKPIVWVTTSASRVRDMKSWLEDIKKEPEFQGMKNPPPDMFFFVEGEETRFFLGQKCDACASTSSLTKATTCSLKHSYA